MEKDLADYRKSYERSALTEDIIDGNPLQQFKTWFHEVERSDSMDEPNAMTLTTIGLDGYPKGRVVLLKKFTHKGFVFYTNYNSEKGKAIASNANVCLSFFWPVMERQVIIKGTAEKLPSNLSDGYFESRPRGSQLGAVVSEQSEVIASRQTLEERLQALEASFEGKEIERPEHWGGFLVRPVSLEFWQGRPNRLHDRILYTLEKDFRWKVERLQP